MLDRRRDDGRRQAVKSPDHPTLTLQANPTLPIPAFNLKRSGGYEGLAQSKDGTKLYGLLEGALFKDDGTMEMVDGNRVLRIVEFDIPTASWTGRSWLYRLADGGDAIGDFNMIDGTTALVIERDQGVGTVDKACADPKDPKPDCFASPAKVKRIYKIEMTDANVGGPVRKIGYIDLLKIADPKNVKRQGGGDGFYDMPFNTIENVDVVDATHIIVADDNNLPFSAGRALDKSRRQRVRHPRSRRFPRREIGHAFERIAPGGYRPASLVPSVKTPCTRHRQFGKGDGGEDLLLLESMEFGLVRMQVHFMGAAGEHHGVRAHPAVEVDDPPDLEIAMKPLSDAPVEQPLHLGVRVADIDAVGRSLFVVRDGFDQLVHLC